VTLDVAGMLAVRARLARLHDAQCVVAGADGDPAVERHRRELFGDPAEPGRPAEEPHRLLLEWIGQPSPKDSPLVIALKARGLLAREEIAALERLARRTVRRADGITSRTLGRRDGLAETYRWGPIRGSYVRSVAFADAEKILAMFETGAEFRIVGNHGHDEGPARRGDGPHHLLGDDAWRGLIDRWRRARGAAPLPPDPLSIRYRPEEGLRRLLGPVGGDWEPMTR
jgi:hypothetical protein